MARQIALQVLRGLKQNLPTLADGEFYFATDSGELYVGFSGMTMRVALMATPIPIQDSAGNNLTSTLGALDVNIKSNTDTPIPVSAAALPLPSGAATDTSLTNGNLRGTVNVAGTVPTTQVGGTSGLTGDTQVKGVQGTVALMVQDFKDAGRTPICFLVDQAAGIAVEALATMIINKGGTVTTGTAYTVSVGKTLRITHLTIVVKASTTTAVDGRARVRSAASVLVTSPIFIAGEATSQAAVANTAAPSNQAIPDGVEFASGTQVGISHIESTATGTISVIAVGFEY